MKIHAIYFIIATFIFYSKLSTGKNLFKRNSILRNDEDWDPAAESFGRANSVKRQQPFDDSHRVNKADFDDTRDEAVETFNDKRNQKRSPFGVVYSGGQPIGVIEPLYQSYQYRNFDDTIHNYKKRDLDNDAMVEIDHQKNIANLHGGKYAAVLANFKIDNRLKTDASKNDDAVSIEKRREKNRITKRDPMEYEEPAKDLSLVEAGSKNKQKRNDNPTLDGDREKRDYSEDEDLEYGPNKISMTKENLERSKKDNISPKVEIAPTRDEALHNVATKSKRNHSPKILNYQSEGEAFIRSRRHNSEVGTIVKDLETSGELTVSGNKSPLVSVNSEQNNSDNKRGTDSLTDTGTVDVKKRSNDYNDYERLLEKNIQDKISAIKSDVKREIYDLKEQDRKKSNIAHAIKKIDVNVNREVNDLQDLERKKRDNVIVSNDGKVVYQNKERKRSVGLGKLENKNIYLEEGDIQKRSNANFLDIADDDTQGGATDHLRINRQVGDDLTEDLYLDLSENNEIARKRETESDDDDVDLAKQKRTIDVSINNDNVNFPHNKQNKAFNTQDFNKLVKRSEDLNIANNSLSNLQAPANAVNVGSVQAPPAVQPAVVPSPPQPNNQLQKPINQQGPLMINNLVPNTLPPQVAAVPQVNAMPQFNGAPQIPQTMNVQQVPPSSNSSQFIASVNQSVQGAAGMVQKQQPHGEEVFTPSAYMPANIGTNRSLRRQNLVNEYDDDGFENDKVEEARSADSDLEDDPAVRIEKDTDDADNVEDDEESDNEKNLVRHERFLPSEEDVRNLENENPSIEQRKRRQAFNDENEEYNYYDDNINLDGLEPNDALILSPRAKRAHYDRFDKDDEMYGEDNFEEPVKLLTYKKRNVDYDNNYDTDNQNNYYIANKRQRRNNNYPTYLENSYMQPFDVPDYYTSEDYRRRKRHASKRAVASGNEPAMKYQKKIQSNDRSFRKKRLGNKANRKSAKDINMDALSNSELFGGLPQSFQGELSRFKRVKRSTD